MQCHTSSLRGLFSVCIPKDRPIPFQLDSKLEHLAIPWAYYVSAFPIWDRNPALQLRDLISEPYGLVSGIFLWLSAEEVRFGMK